jgi:outer membrane lipoprotein carrier protein
MKNTLLALSMGCCALAAQANGLEALDNFVKTARSGRADFTQVVTAPASGTFEFARPNRFRFEYRKPFQQSIVADGQTLWLHDVDLNQVTARKQDQVLGSTPAALVAAAPDLAAVRKDFNLEAAPDRDGLQWVRALPRTREGQLSEVRIGFRGNELARLEILDGFGQQSVMTFSKLELNAPVRADAFRFQVPQGADVVRQ